MSNRKNKKQAKRHKAPADALGEMGAPPATRKIDYKGWFLTGLKVTVGTLLVLGLTGALAFGVHRYARTTPRFAIEEIVVEGTRRLERNTVLSLAEISRGQNVFALDVEQAEKKLLQSPWIKQVRINRRLPGTVSIELTEREPEALAVIDGETFVVSQQGEPFKEFGVGDPHDLPVVTGLTVAELARDRRAELERLKEALELLSNYEELAMAKAYAPQEVHLTPARHAVLSVGERGLALHLGPGPWKQKLLRAARVVKKTRRAQGEPGVVFLDNEAHPERVVVRVQ